MMQCKQELLKELLWTRETYKQISKFSRINNIVLPVSNIPQASANNNVTGIKSGKAKSRINAQKAGQE